MFLDAIHLVINVLLFSLLRLGLDIVCKQLAHTFCFIDISLMSVAILYYIFTFLDAFSKYDANGYDKTSGGGAGHVCLNLNFKVYT